MMNLPESFSQGSGCSQIDQRLHSLLEADEDHYAALLGRMINEYAKPLIYKILGSRLQKNSAAQPYVPDTVDVEDLYQEAILKLVACLNALRKVPSDCAIRALDEFIAKIVYNVYNNYLRGRYPQRHKLKRRLHYVLITRSEFAMWREGYDRIAGFVWWKGVRPAQHYSNAVIGLYKDSWPFTLAKLDGKPFVRVPLDHLLVRLFEWIDHPLEVDNLVDLVAGLLGIKDQLAENGHCVTGEEDNLKQTAVHQAGELKQVEMREYLSRLWNEIKELPVSQRRALLFGLRGEGGDGLIAALPVCGIASPERIAEVLEIDPDELARIWAQFPLKDALIGSMLGGSAQTVINLRKSARERLARRMRRLPLTSINKDQANLK